MSSTVKTTLKVVGVLVAIAVLYFIRDVLGYLLLSFVFASALKPGVNFLEKKNIPRTFSAILIFLLFLIFLGALFYLVLPPLINEVQNFISTFPQYRENFLSWLPQFEDWLEKMPFGQNIANTINQSIEGLSKAVGSVIGVIYGFFGQVFDFFFILIVAFYLLIEKDVGGRLSQLFFSKNDQTKTKISKYCNLAEKIAGRWLQGYIFLGIIVGILVYIGLLILGAKYALILAVLAGALEIIPFFGPVFAGVAGFILCFFQGGWTMALWAAFIFFIVQQLENYLIVPMIMKNRVDLNPLLTIIVLFIGGRLGGFLGMILAVPITAILLAFLKERKV